MWKRFVDYERRCRIANEFGKFKAACRLIDSGAAAFNANRFYPSFCLNWVREPIDGASGNRVLSRPSILGLSSLLCRNACVGNHPLCMEVHYAGSSFGEAHREKLRATRS